MDLFPCSECFAPVPIAGPDDRTAGVMCLECAEHHEPIAYCPRCHEPVWPRETKRENGLCDACAVNPQLYDVSRET